VRHAAVEMMIAYGRGVVAVVGEVNGAAVSIRRRHLLMQVGRWPGASAATMLPPPEGPCFSPQRRYQYSMAAARSDMAFTR